MTDETQAVAVGRYRIYVEHVEGPNTAHGWFATEQDAECFAWDNRNRLGLVGCLSWHVEHEDA